MNLQVCLAFFIALSIGSVLIVGCSLVVASRHNEIREAQDSICDP